MVYDSSGGRDLKVENHWCRVTKLKFQYYAKFRSVSYGSVTV